MWLCMWIGMEKYEHDMVSGKILTEVCGVEWVAIKFLMFYG